MIRHASPIDIPAITEIYNDAILNSTATFDLEPKTLEDRNEWLLSHKANHPVLVYEKDGQVVAYASLSAYRDKKAYDHSVELSLYIDKNFRGIGIGNELMTEILEQAKQHPNIHTVISVITGGNQASIYLHEKFGFTHCGRVKETGCKFGNYLDIDIYQIMV